MFPNSNYRQVGEANILVSVIFRALLSLRLSTLRTISSILLNSTIGQITSVWRKLISYVEVIIGRIYMTALINGELLTEPSICC